MVSVRPRWARRASATICCWLTMRSVEELRSAFQRSMGSANVVLTVSLCCGTVSVVALLDCIAELQHDAYMCYAQGPNVLDEQSLIKAVRDLRAHLKMNQVTFGVMIGKSYPTVQRYEQVAAPPAKELAVLAEAARSVRRFDLYSIFREGAIQSVPEEVLRLIQTKDVSVGPDTEETTTEGNSDQRERRPA